MTDLLQRNALTPLHALPAPDETRRRLLMFGACAGAAVAAEAAPVLASPAVTIAPVDIDARSLGYQETGHIRAYYTTTRI